MTLLIFDEDGVDVEKRTAPCVEVFARAYLFNNLCVVIGGTGELKGYGIVLTDQFKHDWIADIGQSCEKLRRSFAGNFEILRYVHFDFDQLRLIAEEFWLGFSLLINYRFGLRAGSRTLAAEGFRDATEESRPSDILCGLRPCSVMTKEWAEWWFEHNGVAVYRPSSSALFPSVELCCEFLMGRWPSRLIACHGSLIC